MSRSTHQRCRDQIHLFGGAPERVPFAELLDPALVQHAIEEEGLRSRERIFTPLVVLWAFLSQGLSTDHSCRKAVSWLAAYLAAWGSGPATRTSAATARRGGCSHWASSGDTSPRRVRSLAGRTALGKGTGERNGKSVRPNTAF